MTGTLGPLISRLYAGFPALTGDPELASVMTATVINDLLARPDTDDA